MRFDPLRLVRTSLMAFGTVALIATLQASCSPGGREFASPDAGDSGSGGDGGTSSVGNAAGTHSGSAGAAGTKNGSSGGSGEAGDGSVGSDAGASNGADRCTTVDDCPAAPNACSQATCSDGQCGFDYAKSGTLAGTQVPGDCQKLVCDGNGALTSAPDDSDLPVDGNACTSDVCKNGVASNPDAPATTACGATGQFKCDGKGSCASCAIDADCGQNNICATYKCTAGACKSTFVPNGQGDPGNTAKDCKKNVCNGSGSTITIVDLTDLPVDNNVCTKDVCGATGVPSNPPEANTKSCGGISLCNGNGQCVCSDPGACTGKCGSVIDGCGVTQACGGCPTNQTCGGGGTAHVCGCIPHAPACVHQCAGTDSDGCGNQVACPGLDCNSDCGCSGTCTVGGFCQCDFPCS